MSNTQKLEENEDVVPTFEEMVTHLDRRRQDILSVLHAADNSRVNTSELRRMADVPSGSMTHHMRTLERWELVEETDRAYVGGGSKAIVWQLTERGTEFCETHLDDLRALPSPEEVRSLQERVSELETQLAAMEQRHERDLDDLEQRVKRMVKSIKNSL